MKVGDTVRLKSGGPSMTIARIHLPPAGEVSAPADAHWFRHAELCEGRFALLELEPVEVKDGSCPMCSKPPPTKVPGGPR